jgi:hypothetical protein
LPWSPAHGVAIVSLPALGAIKLSHRLQQTMLDAAADAVREAAYAQTVDD